MVAEENLQNKIEQWKAMPRNNGLELTLADKFFDEILMPLSLKKFVDGELAKRWDAYDGMVLTLGTSWQPLALSISALHPQQVLVLGTEDTEKYFWQLQSFLGSANGNIEWRQVDRARVDDIYKACLQWQRNNQGMIKVCADITGGTKAMVSGLAMYAAKANWDIFYVESKYLPLYRRPEPGSEMLVKLQVP